MRKLNPVPQDPSADPVSLAAAAVHSLIQTLPAGTAFFIGIVLIVMMTGRLVQTKGSLARVRLFPSCAICVGGGTVSSGPWSVGSSHSMPFWTVPMAGA